MKKKILIIEPLSYKKHKNLVKSIINDYKKEYKVDLIASKSFSEDLETIYTLKDERISYKNRFEFVLKQLLILFRLQKYFNDTYHRIIFTSYENYSMAFYSIIFSPSFDLLVNNNFKKSRIAKLLNKQVFLSNTPIYFEDSFRNYINTKKYYLQNHPLGQRKEKKTTSTIRDYILCHFTNKPSNSELTYLIQLAEKKNCHLLTNSKYCKDDQRFVYNSFFKDYYEVINNARILYLSIDYEYRISGVFYDFIGFPNEIIINCKSKFYSNLLQKYSQMPNLTYYSNL